MRVLHIVRQFSPAVGGLENFVLCLARAQRQAGLQPEVLTLDTVFHRVGPKLPATDVVEGIAVRRVPWFGSHRYPIALSAASHLSGYDIIHVHAVDFFADYLPLIRLLHKTPLVLSTHGGFFHSEYASRLKKLFFNTITRWSMRGYKRVIACSDGDLSMFAPLCQPWLKLIYNGVDIEKFAEQGSQTYGNNFLFIGRFSNNKRIDLLLQTIYHLKAHMPDVRLSVIGRDWDNNLVQMQQQMAKLDLLGQVSVLIDLDDSAIKAQISRHSYIVSASDYEGFGMTLVEGMAAGLVPIASPITSFKKILDEAGVGHLSDFHDPVAAAQSIFGYTQRIKDQYLDVRNAAITAAARYGWPGTAALFKMVYDEVLGTHTRVIQGVAIDTRTGSDVIAALDAAVKQRNPVRIAIANAHTVNLTRQMPAYRQLLRNFLVLNDGAGVNIASRLKYHKPFAENLNGTDFVPRLLAESSLSLRIFLVGARPEIIKLTHQRFAERYPQHQWLGYYDGFAPPEQEAARCAHIRSLAPDLVLVAMGNPLQEQWIGRCGDQIGASVYIGVGALFDFVAGAVERAPLWIRQIWAEWIYRLTKEPRRMWRRYLVGNITFLWAAKRDRV
ncbi:MAG: WecB/TagA/CpsF family glycosyltransferase [Polaromonas sp.]|jgi:alpha-1,3-mannosyltransferase|nr:WecB/TagA/CpsF family glycosyltransferase [Polaromonas sp.]